MEEFSKSLDKIWETRQLTNFGHFHNKFEQKIMRCLDNKNVSLVNNATNGLIIAQKALGFKNEIITTPFTFIATAHSIKWNNFSPIFVDTDSKIGNLDPNRVEEAINKKTGGILAVHNYGIPGDVKGLKEIADKYNIPLIYDAAPSFGSRLKGRTILEYGDISIVSFHATKVLTTMEGGAIISKTRQLKNKIDKMRNFSIVNEETIEDIGTNAKMNEIESAMGLIQLKYLNRNIKARKKVFDEYYKHLKNIEKIRLIKLNNNLEYNYAYLPIFFRNGFKDREEKYKLLANNGIYCRKYWYPLITHHPIYSNSKKYNLSNATNLSRSVLSLPIYPGLQKRVIRKITNLISQ